MSRNFSQRRSRAVLSGSVGAFSMFSGGLCAFYAVVLGVLLFLSAWSSQVYLSLLDKDIHWVLDLVLGFTLACVTGTLSIWIAVIVWVLQIGGVL